ncbi:MAG: DNA repair protein RadA [bacterium]|nr:DNA repair protein RadA [bacterium]
MPKSRTNYTCTNCGANYGSWSGKCASCNEWNTLEEHVVVAPSRGKTALGTVLKSEKLSPLLKETETRLMTDTTEIDTVLGGGFVKGSVVLLAGEPGIGKSTLLMQIAHAISQRVPVLYVSGEESVVQVANRARRLNAINEDINLSASSSANDIAAAIASNQYRLVIVDSIQTVSCQEITSAAGTMSQITHSTQLLTAAAKESNTTLIIVGHVTKEGAIAGPKLLEHSVDVVLQLEGDRFGGFKLLRAVKNRYGATHEVGIFEMSELGLIAVDNPSVALLAERQITDGSVVLATMEGTRSILVEIQALVNRSNFGYPKRTASGFDVNRLNLLVAMLEKRTKLQLSDKDIYINVVGGIKLTEPAADLAICMAIGSAAKGMSLVKNAVIFGEVGLSGELRHVPFADKRIEEARRIGFDAAIGPKTLGSKKLPKFYEPQLDVRSALNNYLK